MIKDMPKLESPFARKEVGKKYLCYGQLLPEYEWILDKNKVIATEKFDGTNVSVLVQDGQIKAIFNRKNRINIWENKNHRFYNGIKNAIEKKYFNPELCTDGQYFGELIGENIQSNSYNDKGQIWLPFDYVKKHYSFNFYYDWLDEHKGTLENFKQLILNLKSLYMRKQGQDVTPEGIVFHNKETGQMCKLRVNMFEKVKKNEN
jgi:hypothetical protein